jgi:hypothetical protein
VVAVWLAVLGLAAAKAPSAKSAAKQPQSSSSKKSAPARAMAAPSSRKTSTASAKPTSAPVKKASSGRRPARKRSARRRRTPSWRTSQQHPVPERYKEIQQALVDRGYLSGPASGEWGSDSTDALRRFQQDRHIEPTGKIDSLSLISLGLGPNRNPASQNGRGIPVEEKGQP